MRRAQELKLNVGLHAGWSLLWLLVCKPTENDKVTIMKLSFLVGHEVMKISEVLSCKMGVIFSERPSELPNDVFLLLSEFCVTILTN